MDKNKFQTMLKSCTKSEETNLFRLLIVNGVQSWKPVKEYEFYQMIYVPRTGKKRGPNPGYPHANKGKKRDPAVVAKIKASNAARRAAAKAAIKP